MQPQPSALLFIWSLFLCHFLMDGAKKERSCFKFCLRRIKYSKQLSVNKPWENTDFEWFSLFKSWGISVENVSVTVTAL
jgi:hypothetical protein